MQIDLQVPEAYANELASLLRKAGSGSGLPEGMAIEVVEPLAGMFGAEKGTWKVRLTVGLATAAQIATIVGFMLTHVPGPAPAPTLGHCEVTLTHSKTKMQTQFPCTPDSPELVKGISDFIAKNGQPDKVQVKHLPSHHGKKR